MARNNYMYRRVNQGSYTSWLCTGGLAEVFFLMCIMCDIAQPFLSTGYAYTIYYMEM